MNIKTQDLTLTALFCALISILSVITIPVGIVPFSLSLFAVTLTAVVLKPASAALAVLSYLLIGSVGIPVFSGFQAGFHILFGPTGGFLLAYIFVALIISMLSDKSVLIASILSLSVLYAIGSLQYSIVTKTDFLTSLKFCVYPFIAFDIIKVILAVKIGFKLKKISYYSK